MESTDHLVDLELLIIEVKHWCAVLHQWPALDFASTNSAVLVQRIPTSFQPKSHPYVIWNVLSIVIEMVNRAVEPPTQLAQTYRNPDPEAAVEEELRLLV